MVQKIWIFLYKGLEIKDTFVYSKDFLHYMHPKSIVHCRYKRELKIKRECWISIALLSDCNALIQSAFLVQYPKAQYQIPDTVPLKKILINGKSEFIFHRF